MPADLARTIMQTITTILIALPLLLACGALIVGYVIWRSRRAVDAQAAKMAASGGGGGPTEPA